MEPSEYARALRRRWRWVALLALLGAAGAATYAFWTPPQYRATSSVFIAADISTSNEQDLLNGSQFAQDAVQTYTQLSTLPVVLDPVIQQLGLHMSPGALAREISATAALNTTIIDIDVTDPEPGRAVAIARATARSLSNQLQRLSPRAGGMPTLTAHVMTDAHASARSVGTSSTVVILAGLVVGLGLGVACAVMLELLDVRISGEEDVAELTDIPILGRVSRAGPGRSMLPRDQDGLHTEEYRRLRTNLGFIDVDAPIQVLLITSPRAGDGKSTTALNLALVAAERGQKVLLIDSDLRRPSVADYTGIDGGVGLTDVLRGAAPLRSAVQSWARATLDVLPAGALPPNPSQIVGSEAMADMIRKTRETYDLVVIDAPPLLPVTDSLALSAFTDGTVLVASHHQSRKPDLQEAIESMELVGSRIIGIVLNRTPAPPRTAYYGPHSSPTGEPGAQRPRSRRRERVGAGRAAVKLLRTRDRSEGSRLQAQRSPQRVPDGPARSN